MYINDCVKCLQYFEMAKVQENELFMFELFCNFFLF